VTFGSWALTLTRRCSPRAWAFGLDVTIPHGQELYAGIYLGPVSARLELTRKRHAARPFVREHIAPVIPSPLVQVFVLEGKETRH
jgi:hypothetical protein